jgi:hypothetical protein
LPIVFPAVAEKVIEKVVEKVKEVVGYITTSLASNILTPIYPYQQEKPSLPKPSVTIVTMSILISIYSLKVYLRPLVVMLVKNPSRPSASLLGQFSTSISGVKVVDAKKPSTLYSTISRPPKPTPTVTQFSTSVGVRKSP